MGLTLDILEIGGRGDGIAEVEGRRYFVPFTLPAETVDYVAKIAPMIGGKVPVMRLAGIASRASWSRGPIFVGRSAVHPDDGSTTSDLPSGRTSNAPAIVDLSALVPPSNGLFVRRPRSDGEQR